MKKKLDPFSTGNAAFWLPHDVIPVPANEDGSPAVDLQEWLHQSHEEIKRYFLERPTQGYQVMLPEGGVIILADDWDDVVNARPELKKHGLNERFGCQYIHDDSSVVIVFFHCEDKLDFDEIRAAVRDKVKIVVPSLTYLFDDEDEADLPAVTDKEDEAENIPDVGVPQTPFDKHSLLGSEAEMERFAVNAVALLGSVIMMGQFGLIYAQPNTGKTLLTIALLLQAIEEKRLDPRLCYYINADDNNEGILEKLQLFNEMGAHTLVPGHKNFDPEKLIDLMLAMVADDQCKGVVLILDTLKCFIDLMDKKRSTQFAKVVRQFVVAGGTFVGLAHTNKNPGGNGKPVYAGTSDFHEACDVACYLIPVENTDQGDKVVKFELFKKRGGGNRNEAYSFSGLNDASYHQLVASVQKIDPDEMQKYEQSAQLVADQLVVEAICNALNDTPQQKMALAKHVSATIKASRRQVIEVLERYAGPDPEQHRWDFVVAERGAKVFALHPAQTP